MWHYYILYIEIISNRIIIIYVIIYIIIINAAKTKYEKRI